MNDPITAIKLRSTTGFLFLDAIQRRLRESKRQKHLTLAANWPTPTAEINRWTILPYDEADASFSSAYQIEAGFHFTLNRTIRRLCPQHPHRPSRPRARRPWQPHPHRSLQPADPDPTAVLAQDNTGNRPFEVFSA